MIVRREKVRKELHRSSMEVFYKQNDMLLDEEEDWSGEKLDFLRHRSTRFTDFSESYVTEKLWKEENGRSNTIFDSTIEDDEELLNTSQIEKFNEQDLMRDSQMPAFSSNRSSFASSPKPEMFETNHSKNDYKNETTTQRNFFDFFKKESKPVLETLDNENTNTRDEASSALKRLDFSDDNKTGIIVLDDELTLKIPINQRLPNITITDVERSSCSLETEEEEKEEEDISDCERISVSVFDEPESIVSEEKKNKLDLDEPSSSFLGDSFRVPNKHKELSVVSNEQKEPPSTTQNGSKITTGNDSDLFRPSTLVRKGKKRFRNLPPAEETQRRNSPRLNKVIEDSFEESKSSYEAPIAKLKSLVSESKKRRRLNSCGDFIGEENGDEQPDYVRITRSRVSSCT